jgi:predicted RNA-binding protein with PIN domain
MPYLIDANNLAGKLGILEQDDFDLKLISAIKQFIQKTNKKIILVFDGSDYWGDKKIEGNLTIVMAPKDNCCQSADDKIIEIIDNAEHKEQLVVITDDRELIEKAKNKGALIKKASYFSQILCQY